VDAEAAAACHEAGLGARLTTCLGHKHDRTWGTPITVTGRVARLTDGRFRYSGGMWNGMEADMGPSAVLEVGSVRVLVATYSTYDWVDEQFRSAGLDPASAKFLVVKNPMNYRLAYGGIAKAVYVLDTPGPTPPTVRQVRYENLQRPYFPVDRDIPEITPRILLSGSHQSNDNDAGRFGSRF
jgi:microcystin degradation protein MlrC